MEYYWTVNGIPVNTSSRIISPRTGVITSNRQIIELNCNVSKAMWVQWRVFTYKFLAYKSWLVVWNMFYFSICWEIHHPN